MTQASLFLSYTTEDLQIAKEIAEYVERNGVTCWFAWRDVPLGEVYADAVARALSDCSACAVLISPAANGSEHVKRELELASRNNKPLIPIRLGEAEPEKGLAYYLGNTQWLDARTDKPHAWDALVTRMSNVEKLPRPPLPPPASQQRGAVDSAVVLFGASVLVLVAWFMSTGDEVEQVLGHWHWDGQLCSSPTEIEKEGENLIFFTPGSPRCRHMLKNTQRNVPGYKLVIETQVTAPAECAGKSYRLGLHDKEDKLEVVEDNQWPEVWMRCPQESQ